MKVITKEWIKRAEEDHRVAMREFKAKPLAYYAVCFHSQHGKIKDGNMRGILSLR